MQIKMTDKFSRMMLTIIAACLCWLSIGYANSNDAPSPRKKVVEAEEFRIVDKSGRLRALLTLHPSEKENPKFEDKPGLYLYHLDGSLAAQFNMCDNMGSLQLRDDNGNACAILAVTKKQTQSNQHQGGYLTVSDSDRKGATLGVWTDWEKGMSPASSLKIFSESGRKIIWEAKP